MLSGSEDTTFKVLEIKEEGHLQVNQTFSQHEASVRSFAKCKVPSIVSQVDESPLVN